MKWIQKKIEGKWQMIPVSENTYNPAVGGIMIMEDIKPFLAHATKEPTIISSRSKLRKYMANNGLIQFEEGIKQDNERNKRLDEANDKRHLKQTIIDATYRY